MLLLSCSVTEPLDKNLRQSHVPSQWSVDLLTTSVEDGWFNELQNAQIHQLVDAAINNNFQLKQQAFAIAVQQQTLIIAGSDLWPSLDVSLNNSRRKFIASDSADSIDNTASVDIDLKYELDLWGKLSDAQQQANLTLMAQKATFEQAKQQLVADVIKAWYSVIEANQLVILYQQRSTNTQENLLIINSGYQQGLNSALDVYLARNEVNNALARASEQAANSIIAIRTLEQLLGQYPQGKLFVDAKLPQLDAEIPLGLPSDLVSRKPELMASWYQLLAQNSALAYAHKQRFPSVNLTASLFDSQPSISDLLSTSSLSWSLLGNLAMPLFNAGELKANAERARLTLKQTEQAYLSTLFDAFADVENAITYEQSLQDRYHVMMKAQDNAIAAEQLSFEQYQRGLVDYLTVLDAQSRSYDAQTTVIQLKKQLIANRINLHIALGGNFAKSSSEKIQKQDK